jgi:hypothetical protein
MESKCYLSNAGDVSTVVFIVVDMLVNCLRDDYERENTTEDRKAGERPPRCDHVLVIIFRQDQKDD